MPISQKVINAFERQYGKKKGKTVLYKTKMKHKKEGKGSFAKV